MLTLLAFIVTIIIIVAFHEWGHFLAMRAFGVRVLTFSVGFGPKLLRFKDKRGTQWVISAIPLGGYVKPLDRREDETAAGDPGEFSGKPAWQRVITYAAGPVFNFILAIGIYWLLMSAFGQRGVAPTVGVISPSTPAWHAQFEPGDTIVDVNGRAVKDWRGIYNGLIHHIGNEQPLPMTVVTSQGQQALRQLDVRPWADDPDQPPLDVLGLTRAVVIGEVAEASAAQAAGLQSGDIVVAVDGEAVLSWADWQQTVMTNADQRLITTVLRRGEPLELILRPQAVSQDGEIIGRVGVGMGGYFEVHYGPVSGLIAAGGRFAEQSGVVWASLVKLVTGRISIDNLGGPITIAQVAGESAAIGLVSFLTLVAYLSITLGVINLLPIPMLDGGWILFGIIEMIRGRSLSERFLMTAQGLGLAVVASIMFLAIYNDLVRQFT